METESSTHNETPARPLAPARSAARRRAPRAAEPSRARRDHEPNSAPSQWGRRLARVVGERFGVQMVTNQARNEGEWRGLDITIKCAKSTAPPVSVLSSSLARLDEMWAVFVLPSGEAEVWRVPVQRLRRHGHFTRGVKALPRVEITRRKVMLAGTLFGTIDVETVESCRIP